MAAPPPYWKKKTRPCPFYSAGRCLFSDACNFVHSVKVNHEPQGILASTAPPEGMSHNYARVLERSDGETEKGDDEMSVSAGRQRRRGVDEKMSFESQVKVSSSADVSLSRSTSMSSNSSSRGTLKRTSSERRRRSVMSPPRSPRLSGLLSVLEPVIGPEPELEEFEEGEEDEEDEESHEQEVEEKVTEDNVAEVMGSKLEEDIRELDTSNSPSEPDLNSPNVSNTWRNSTALPYLQDSPRTKETSPPVLSVEASTSILESTDKSSSTERPSNTSFHRPHIPAPIITQSHVLSSIVLDNSTPEVHTYRPQSLLFIDDPLTSARGSRPPSTFELLTSPFAAASPALRILSPQMHAGDTMAPIFSAIHGMASTPTTRSRPYADDDVDSLETLESSEESSENAAASSSVSQDTDESKDYSEESFEIVERVDESLSENLGEIDSPHDTERPVSDYFRTPRNLPYLVESMPPDQQREDPSLPSPQLQKSDEARGQQRLSQARFSDGGREVEPSPSSTKSRTSTIHSDMEVVDHSTSSFDVVQSSPKKVVSSPTEQADNAIESEAIDQTRSPSPIANLSSSIGEVAHGDSPKDLGEDFIGEADKEGATVEEIAMKETAREETTVEEIATEKIATEEIVVEDQIDSVLDELLQDASPESSSLEYIMQDQDGSDVDSETELEHVVASYESPLALGQVHKEDAINLSSPFESRSRQDVHREETSTSSPASSRTNLLQRLIREESITSDDGRFVVAPILRLDPSENLAKIDTSSGESNPDSPTTDSLDPSPVFSDQSSSHTHDTFIEPNDDENVGKDSMHETIFERRAKNTVGSPKRLEVVSVISPTKVLRETLSPSVEKTVKPSPSPLYDESRHSTTSSASSSVSSPRPSWAELQKRSGASQKVPFGFRQSLLVDEIQSSTLAKRLSAHSINDSTGSLASSLANLSPNPRPASRVDMLAGRARSVSPAGFASGSSGKRDSLASIASSNSSFQRNYANPPRSASQVEFSSKHLRAESPASVASSDSSSSKRQSWMKPLRLSHNVNSASSSISDRQSPTTSAQEKRSSIASIHSTTSHVHHVSHGSLVDNSLLSSSRSSIISAYLNDTDIPSHDNSSVIISDESRMPSLDSILFSSSVENNDTPLDGGDISHHRSQSAESVDENVSNLDLLSPLSGSMRGLDFEELSKSQCLDAEIDPDATAVEPTIPPLQVLSEEPPESLVQPQPISEKSAPLVEVEKPPPTKLSPPKAQAAAPSHAIATPRPTLMFAIASDNPAEVERVLASGEAHINDAIGPQSALEFALTNDALVNKTEIVKTLLAFGADPSSLSTELRESPTTQVQQGSEKPTEASEEEDILTDLPSEATGSISKRKKRESVLNPAMKYYLNRATAGQTSAALRRTDFRPLARMRFDFVGQDRALEHLYWVLGMHSQQPIGTPLVVLCCGPSGHGKSLLARKFGSLLDVPTHTVNMTVLKTSHDLWQCPSMSPYDPPSQLTLAEFLEENAGKRCVVVLDEIDKNEDERTLWSLLAPWELGRCSIDATRRHIDVRNVIWLGTSNLGQGLVFENHKARKEPDTIMTKAEYRELMNSLRPLVTERLGTSLMSRVTAVLPFVPFTEEEKLAIASEAVLALGGDMASELGPEEFEQLAAQCVSEYVSTDGARSLYRSVSTHLMDAF